MSGLGVFGDIANSLGPFVGGADIAGFILGFVSVVVFTVVIAGAIAWASGKDVGSNGIWIGFGISLIIVTLIQWFPIWTPLFIVIIYLASRYFGSSGVALPG